MGIKECLVGVADWKNNVITGSCGIEKSGELFRGLLDITRGNDDIYVLSYRSYDILKEQRQRLLTVGFTDDEVCITGPTAHNCEYYTQDLMVVNSKCRIIMMTHASIQRCNYTLVITEKGNSLIQRIKRVIVDEFSYDMGIIPALSSLLALIKKNGYTGFNRKAKSFILGEIKKNFTLVDARKFEIAQKKEEEYFIAHWIERQPVTVISVESTVVNLLTSIGFSVFVKEKNGEDVTLDLKKFVVRYHSCSFLNRYFFKVANQRKEWNSLMKLGYTDIISNSIKNYFEQTNSELEIDITTINGCYGSNKFALEKRNPIAIIPYCHPEAVQEIVNVISYFNDWSKEDLEDIESIKQDFYCDILNQTVSRVIGYRSKLSEKNSTDVIIHSDILELVNVESFPYKLVPFELEWERFDYIEQGIRELRNKDSLVKKGKEQIVSDDLSKILPLHYVLTNNPKDFLSSKEIKDYNEKNNICNVRSVLTATSTIRMMETIYRVEHQGEEVYICDNKVKKVNGKTVVGVLGMKFK